MPRMSPPTSISSPVFEISTPISCQNDNVQNCVATLSIDRYSVSIIAIWSESRSGVERMNASMAFPSM